MSCLLSIEHCVSHLVIEELRGAERGERPLVGDDDVLLSLLVPLAAVTLLGAVHK